MLAAKSAAGYKKQLAYVGEGEFKAGDHCQFCKVKATCRKRAEYNLELAKYDFDIFYELSYNGSRSFSKPANRI